MQEQIQKEWRHVNRRGRAFHRTCPMEGGGKWCHSSWWSWCQFWTFLYHQAYELSTLTGTQVMLLVASETGHVYTFATRKLQPMITSESGKALIQTCLNSPDSPLDVGKVSNDQRMNPTGYEETDLSYAVSDDETCQPASTSPYKVSNFFIDKIFCISSVKEGLRLIIMRMPNEFRMELCKFEPMCSLKNRSAVHSFNNECELKCMENQCNSSLKG